MYKRKSFGYSLLLMLVLSGFAGTFHSNTISKEERKFAVTSFKDSKKELLQAVKGLSDNQLNYKPSAGKWSIKECMIHIMQSENTLWDMVEKSLTQSSNPEKRTEIKMTDDPLLKGFTDRTSKAKTIEPFYSGKIKYNSMEETVEAFKNHRSLVNDFLKSTNADLRNHVIQLPFGTLDAYQLCLVISANSNIYLHQIMEIKESMGFPKS